MNKGEAAEFYLKAYLLREKDRNGQMPIFQRITELSDDQNLSNISWKKSSEHDLNNFNIRNLAQNLNLSKSKTGSKADISINGTQFSVKEVNHSPPAIVNHTSRPGFENVCGRVNSDIRILDKIISDYWKLRNKGIIKEDVDNRDPNSPFLNYKEYLRPIINYFVFAGTGRGDSDYPASEVLEINYKNLPGSIRRINKNDYFDEVWPRLRFSLRSKKGMPSTYPNCDDYQSVSKWTVQRDGSYKGALHIRVRKK